MIMSKEMFVLRRKNTDEYMRNNGYFRDLDDTGKSAIKLYESEKLCRSAVRGFEEDYDFVPVEVTIGEIDRQKNMLELFAEELKQEIKNLDKHHDRIVDIGEVFRVIDKLTKQHDNGKTKQNDSSQHNTEITYIYRDNNNNKKWFTYILKGVASEEQVRAISNCLHLYDKGFDFFNPQLVGLPDGGYIHEEGDWFEWMENSVLPTDKAPTINMTVEELVSAFKNAKEQDWSWDYLNEKEERD